MKFLFLFIFILGVHVIAAQNNYSIRVAVGKPTLNSMGETLLGSVGNYDYNLKAYNIDGGYLLKQDLLDLRVDLYFKGGLTYYEERFQNDIYGVDIYVKFYYNIDLWQNRIRIGVGEGASYTNHILKIEQIDAALHNDTNTHFLNYLDVSLDFDLGKLFRYKALHETYIGVLLKHRSGIFGLIDNVRHGGSNYESIFIEKNF